MKTFRIALVALLLSVSSLPLIRGDMPAVQSGQWVATGTMSDARSGASALLLPSGLVLVTGGAGTSGVLATAELFGPDGQFSAAGSMLSARADHASVLLGDGRVLIVGGRTDDGNAVASAETMGADGWSAAGQLTDARWGHTATLLLDGRVLIVGGENESGAVGSVETFDPATGEFAVAGTLTSPRKGHAAARLVDGRVLIAGGFSGGAVLNSIDIFDPSTGSVSVGPSLNVARAGFSATTLLDGKVLFAGGNDGANDLASAEVFNPVAGTVTATAAAATARRDHQAFLLPNNNSVLIVGGVSAGAPAASAELYVPWVGEFRATGSMVTPRAHATGAALSRDGLLLVAGGDGLASSDTYGFATVRTDRDDYSPGETVYVSGSGWQPNENVTFGLREVPQEHESRTFAIQADDAGNIANALLFLVEDHHFGVRFFLTARGAASQAQIRFTDGNKTTFALTQTGDSVTSFASANTNACVAVWVQSRQGSNLDAVPTGGGTVALSSSPSGATFHFNGACTGPGVTSFPVSAGQQAWQISFKIPSAGDYVIKADGSWSNDSNDATASITISAPSCTAPSITTQPVSQSIGYGNDAAFTAAAAGSPAPTVQWQVSTDGGLNFNNLSGQTNTTLTLSTPTVSMSGNRYRAVFTNVCGGTQTATTNSATLTVAPKTVTVTPNSGQSKTYSGSAATDPTLAYTLSEPIAVTGALARATGEDVGGYAITLGSLASSSSNYTLALSGTVNFTIARAPTTTTVTCEAGPFSYSGAAQEPCAATVTGAGGLNDALAVSYTNNINAGTASASATYAESANYSGSSDSEEFTIAKAATTTTVTCEAGPFSYTGAAQEPCAAVVTGAGGLNETLTVSYTNNVNAGTASASATYAETANYATSTDSKNFTIAKAATLTTVTCTAGPFSYTGAAQTPCAATVTGAGGLNDALAVSYTNNINAGTASASATYAESANYSGSSDSEEFTIAKAATLTTVTCTAGPFSYTGVAQTPCAAVVTGAGGLNETLTVSYTNNVNAGTASASATYAETANYATSTDSKNFTIGRATLTVKADNKTKLLNAVNPPLTYGYSGFVSGQTLATSGVTGDPSLSTTALPNSPVGSYPITAVQGTLAALNYTFAFVNGNLSVLYRWDGFLQPINDTAHDLETMSKFKLGQTIPAKFDIKDVNGNIVQQIGNPTFNYALIGGCAAADPDSIEAVYQPSTAWVYTLTGGHYQYNWSTKGIAAGLYRVQAKLNDGTTQSVDICLTK